MPLTHNPQYIHEPTPLQCGQAVLAMLSGKTVNEVVNLVGTEKETTLNDMLTFLDTLEIRYVKERCVASKKHDLPDICILSLETPHCWHWSLYYNGVFYDPEYGMLNDFPPSNRRYYWKISE